MVLLSSLLVTLCLLLVLTITKIVQILSYSSSDFMCSSEENPTFLPLYNTYFVPYIKIPLSRTLECDFLCSEWQHFIVWETVTSSCLNLKFTLAPYTSTFYGTDLVSYLMNTNIYCKFNKTMLFFLFLNNMTESNQQGK